MRKEEYLKRRTAFIIVGVCLMLLLYPLAGISWDAASLSYVVGLSMILYGCYCWAKGKGRGGWFLLLGLVGCVGFLILWRLKDNWIEVRD